MSQLNQPESTTNRFQPFAGKTPNYIDHEDEEPGEPEESSSEIKDSDDETSEPDEENDQEDEEVEGSDAEFHEELNSDQNGDFDQLIRSSSRGIKKEHDLDGQTEDEQLGTSKKSKASEFALIRESTAFDCYDFNELIRRNQKRMKTESFSGSNQSEEDEDGEQPPESSTVTSSNLNVVYGVEYIAPDESDQFEKF